MVLGVAGGGDWGDGTRESSESTGSATFGGRGLCCRPLDRLVAVDLVVLYILPLGYPECPDIPSGSSSERRTFF